MADENDVFDVIVMGRGQPVHSAGKSGEHGRTASESRLSDPERTWKGLLCSWPLTR